MVRGLITNLRHHALSIVFLFFALPAQAQILSGIMNVQKASGGGGVTWTLIQSPHNLDCDVPTAVTSACSLTATTTAGDALIACSVIYANGVSAPTSASMSGDGTWTQAPSTYSGTVVGAYIYGDCYYRLSATGGSGETFTYTWNTPTNPNDSYIDLVVIEVRRSTGTATYDTRRTA